MRGPRNNDQYFNSGVLRAKIAVLKYNLLLKETRISWRNPLGQKRYIVILENLNNTKWQGNYQRY